MNNLESIIRGLIETKREDCYWDFKEIYHKNKAEQLHDIICLSNSLHKGNRYLIFGISDPKDSVIIKGLKKEHPNRKKQSNFIDFLRDKPFVGGIRPEIELHTIIIDNLEIDVLVIFDNPNKPYYLTQDYSNNSGNKNKIVKANHIYTRINDTNTPIDKSADIDKVEKMWKQRFTIDLTPIEKMQNLLQKPENWFKDIGNKSYAYNKDFPELNLSFSKTEKFWEPYSYFFLNENSFLGNVEFKYHSTILFELEYMYCDEMRVIFPIPEFEILKIDGENENWYYYFDLSSNKGKFLIFLTDNLINMESRGVKAPFILFKNKQERYKFNEYVLNHKKEFNEIEPYYYSVLANDKMIKANKNTVMSPTFAGKIIEMHKIWKTGSV